MRAIPVTIVALAATATLAGGPVSETRERDIRLAMNYSQRGISSFQKGNVARAAEDFDKALARVPGLPEAHLGKGHVAMRRKNFDEALREYRFAQEGYRELASDLLQMSTQRFAKSRDELQHLRDLDRQLASASSTTAIVGASPVANGTMGLSSAQIERQRVEVSHRIAELEAMSQPGPETAHEAPADVFFFEGNALFNLKRLDEAISAWEESARRDPKFAPVQNNLAVAYFSKRRIEDARAAIERAAALGFQVNPDFRSDVLRASSVGTGEKP